MKPQEIQASITKQEIPYYHSREGRTNADRVWLLGESREPRSVMFRGFAGALDLATGTYEGVFRVELGSFPDADAISFDELNLRGE